MAGVVGITSGVMVLYRVVSWVKTVVSVIVSVRVLNPIFMGRSLNCCKSLVVMSTSVIVV